MKVIVNHTDNKLIEVGKSPELGEQMYVNGRYLLPVPEGSDLDIEKGAKVISDDGSFGEDSLVHQAFEGLLAQYPMYGHIIYNPNIVDKDVDDYDLDAGLTEVGPPMIAHESRAQLGRYPGSKAGNSAGSTLVLPQNNYVDPARPGLLITNTLDITPMVDECGADEFMVWWMITTIDDTHDVMTDYGFQAGTNTPTLQIFNFIEQEPDGLEVLLSVNDGASYFKVDRLEPIAFCDPATKLRLAFLNRGDQKYRILGWAIMF